MKIYTIEFKLEGNPCYFRVLVTAVDRTHATQLICQAWSQTEVKIIYCAELEIATVIIL